MEYSHDPQEEQICQNAQRVVMPPIFHKHCTGNADDNDREKLCNEMRNHLYAVLFGDCMPFWERRGVAGTMMDLSRIAGYGCSIEPEITATRQKFALLERSDKCSRR